MGQFLAVEAQRKQVDQTVWATELIAEEHEDVFIELWDELRRTEDEYAALAGFQFTTLILGTPGETTIHENGIQQRRPAQPGQTLTSGEWRQWLAGIKEQGYRVEQTEWRNPQFDPGPPARSVMYLSAHITNPGKTTRLIVRGDLRVEWQEGSQGGQPVPRLIDASNLEILERQGPGSFQHVFSLAVEPDMGTIFIDPLILYDLDGDGLSEIILGCKNLVLRNLGGGQFRRDVLCKALRGPINTCVIADFDGDGGADFLASDFDGLLLFVGDKQGNFTKAGRRVWSAREKLLNPFVLTAGDIDGDSDLDVWLAQYKLPYVEGQMPTPYYDANDGFPSFLLANNGGGDFDDETETSGLTGKRFRRTYSSSLADLDEDGDLDLIVVSDFAGVDLHYNDGHGHFTDVSDKVLEGTRAFGMAHTFGDYDGDGKQDFLVVGMNSFVAQRLNHLGLGPPEVPDYQAMRQKMAYGNRLFFARGKKFDQTPMSDQVSRSGWSWGATTFDFDNDGDLDIYITTGHKSRATARDYERQFWRHDIYLASSKHNPVLDLYFRATAERLYGAGQSYGGYEKNRLFVNESAMSFLEAAHLFGVAIEEDCRNVLSDDLDGDGKLDLIFATFQEWPEHRQGVHIFQNRWEHTGNWIGVRLRETSRGYSPAGATIVLTSATGKQTRQIVTGDSYRSQSTGMAHFGLGKVTNVTSVAVRWPNGRTTTLPSPAINRYHEVTPSGAKADSKSRD